MMFHSQAPRPSLYQSSSIDISEAGATIDCVFFTRGGYLRRVSYIVTEALGTMDTGALQVGYADADGGNDSTDAFILGTTDEDNGLLVSSKAVGYCKNLTLVGNAVPAGKILTISHIQDAGENGTLRVLLEFAF